MSSLALVILQNSLQVADHRFINRITLHAVKHQAEAGSGKPASDMLSGDISQRLERDLSSASSVVTDILPTIVVTLVQLFGAFFLMRSIDSILAWSLLVLTPVVAVCAKYLGSRLKKMTLAIREEESSIQMMIQETVEHELTIKTLQAESTSISTKSCRQRKIEVGTEGIDRLHTHTVQTDALLERLAVVLTAGIQHTYSLNELSLRNTTTIVAHADTQIVLDIDFQTGTCAHLEFIDRVVYHLLQEHINTIFWQISISQTTDVHTRTGAYMLHIAQVADVIIGILYRLLLLRGIGKLISGIQFAVT